MKKIFKRVVLIWSVFLLGSGMALGQSHFVYFQSKKNIPFYLRINNSLKNSSSKGYLVLHDLSKGKHVFVIGLAGKRVPEAAFQLKFDDEKNEGFLIKDNSGTLNLVKIRSKKAIKPIKTATAAGNRIRSLPEEQTTEEPQSEASEDIAKTEKEEDEGLSFGNMLNAVTGSGDDTSVPVAKAPEKTAIENEESAAKGTKEKKTELEADFPTVDTTENREERDEAEGMTKTTSDQKDKEAGGLFDQLLQGISSTSQNHRDKPKQRVEDEDSLLSSAQETEATPAPEKQPDEDSSGLTFLNFDNTSSPAQEGGDIVEQAEGSTADIPLKQPDKKKKQKKRKRLSFEDLLTKIDTTTTDTSNQSLAKPLLEKEQQRAKAASCSSIAGDAFFKKVKRKVAARSTSAGMLRTVSRYFSDDQCFTLSQIREISYLFASEEDRLHFLEKAYPHSADPRQFDKLIKTLDAPYYRKQLKAFLR